MVSCSRGPRVPTRICFLIEFLICHTLLVMIAVIVLLLAAQMNLFTLLPMHMSDGRVGEWTTERWLSLVALEMVIIYISLRFAGNQVNRYQQTVLAIRAKQASPEQDLATVSPVE